QGKRLKIGKQVRRKALVALVRQRRLVVQGVLRHVLLHHLPEGFPLADRPVKPLTFRHLGHHFVVDLLRQLLVVCLGGLPYLSSIVGKAHPPCRASSEQSHIIPPFRGP